MPKIIRRCLITFGGILAIALLWIFRPYASPDPDAVSKNLSELQEPFQSVDTVYFLDGGSVGIRIVDAQGESADFCLRAAMGDGDRRYERLYFGALHYTDEPSTEILQPSETILRILEIVRSADGIDPERDIAVASTSGRWRDFSKILWRKFVSREY